MVIDTNNRFLLHCLNWSGYPILGLLLFTVSAYMAVVMMRLQEGAFADVLPLFVTYFAAVIFSSIVLSPIMRRLASKTANNECKHAIFLLFPAVCLVFTVAIRCLDYSLWEQSTLWRCIVISGQGLALPIVYSLFFFSLPQTKTGAWFGISLTGGMAAMAVCHLILQKMGFTTADGIRILFHSRTIVLALMGLALMAGMLRWLRYGEQFIDAYPKSPNLRRDIAVILAAIAVFFTLNGFLHSQLLPFVLGGSGATFPEVPIALAIACPLVGIYVDKHPKDGNGRVIKICSILFMLAPVLAVLPNQPSLYRLLYNMIVIAYFCAALCVARTLTPLAIHSAWSCLVLASVHVGIILAVGVRWLFHESAQIEPNIVVLLGIIMAMLLYHLQIKITANARWQEDAAALKSDAPAAATPDDLFAVHSLSPRERDVAAFLLKGKTTKSISEELRISDKTVATHVKNILRKFDVPSQKAFLSLFIAFNGEPQKKYEKEFASRVPGSIVEKSDCDADEENVHARDSQL